MLATPITVRDIVLGQLAYVVFRLALVAVIFVAWWRCPRGGRVARRSCWPIPAAILTGLAFATPISAFAACASKSDSYFSLLFRFVITPMFLFSGTFFPIEQLPDLVQPIAYLTPLYHGVALTRGLALGSIDALGIASTPASSLALAVVGAILFDRGAAPAARVMTTLGQAARRARARSAAAGRCCSSSATCGSSGARRS